MTILQALAGYYDRMARRGEAEAPGFSRKLIDFAVVIDGDGLPVHVTPLRQQSGRKMVGRAIDVPAEVKRTVAVAPNFLWDKTAYALGVTASDNKRTAQEQEAFRALHIDLLVDSDDAGLIALRRFVEGWTPDRFTAAPFTQDMLDANIVFRLDGDAIDGTPRFIHQRPAALPLIEARGVAGDGGICLVSGTQTPLARLHPAIRGVDGAQMAGAALVSFNAAAYESYGREQGANAPTGQVAAFKYGAALNRLLDRDSRHRLELIGGAHVDPTRPRQIVYRQRARLGDATIVFWADSSGLEEAQAAAGEAVLASTLNALDLPDEPVEDDDDVYAAPLRDALAQLADGRTARLGAHDAPPGVRLHVLGLSPNAARLSVRFWLTDTLGGFAGNVMRHAEDCSIMPTPHRWGAGPSINRLLVKTTAAQEKWENIPPQLAGEMSRAVLMGGRYPRTLLTTAMMRLRAGDDPGGGWHAAAIRGVLAREHRERLKQKNLPDEKEWLMSLDTSETNPAYRLGRLFAVLEAAQYNALGRVNATIRDRFFGAASATPATVFPLLLRGGQNHIASLRKEGKAGGIERDLEEIMSGIGTALPPSLRLEDQGRFAIGYYHQRAARFVKKDAVATEDQGEDQ